MLKVRKITKRFGNIVALENINFDINDGDFVFLTGPSGAGKTTLLKLILREITPDEGEIWLDGVNVIGIKDKEVPALRQKIGVVFQDFKVLPERTLKENIEVALAVVGLKADQWDDRVNQVLEIVGLAKRQDMFPSQLSGGELQRASLARALVVNPKIILADEPTGNLDWETADAIMDLFEKISEKGKTVIMATHHKGIIEKHKKKTIELREGKIVKGGLSKEELKRESVGANEVKPDVKLEEPKQMSDEKNVMDELPELKKDKESKK